MGASGYDQNIRCRGMFRVPQCDRGVGPGRAGDAGITGLRLREQVIFRWRADLHLSQPDADLFTGRAEGELEAGDRSEARRCLRDVERATAPARGRGAAATTSSPWPASSRACPGRSLVEMLRLQQ